jgi:hypothetical protein
MCAVAVNACDAPDASVTLAGDTVTDSSTTGAGPPSEPEHPTMDTAASSVPRRTVDSRALLTRIPLRIHHEHSQTAEAPHDGVVAHGTADGNASTPVIAASTAAEVPAPLRMFSSAAMQR